MNLELMFYQKTEAQSLAESILGHAVERKLNNELTTIISFIPIHAQLFDEKQIQTNLDIFREALTEVSRTLDLRHPLPNSEFEDNEIDKLVNYACEQVEKIFRGESQYSKYLLGNELISDVSNIRVYVKCWINFYIFDNERTLGVEFELFDRDKQ